LWKKKWSGKRTLERGGIGGGEERVNGWVRMTKEKHKEKDTG